MNICVIPARGGSKRIPRKNVRTFCGRPMISWSISAAFNSGVFDRIIVSTDDTEIMNVARQEGAEVPFSRPKQLSGDFIATRPVVNHAITAIGCKTANVCCIYPTAPFLDGKTIRLSLDYLENTNASFVFSAASYPAPIQRSFRIIRDGSARRLYPQHRLTRSQDLEQIYHDAGQFYWGKGEAFLAGTDTVSPKGHPFVLPREQVHDIDTPEDWNLAELIFRATNRVASTK